MVLTHLLEQHAHGCQRRAQFMGGACCLRGHGQQLLITQAFFATDRSQLFLTAQLFSHARGEESDHRRRKREAQPHPVHLQVFPGDREGLQRIEARQQQGVHRQRDARQNHRITPRQCHGGDGQRHQVIRDEGVGRTAGEIQQGTVDKQVAGQLHGVFKLGDRPRSAQSNRRERTQQHRATKGRGQLEPGQR
ncbi:hypothetical protein D3C86_1597560 [compost metagenome]